MQNPYLDMPTQSEPNRVIEEGDAGIVLRHDGTFSLFTCHPNLDPQQLTPEQINQGAILHAFKVALQVKPLMLALMEQAQLYEAALILDGDPGVKH